MILRKDSLKVISFVLIVLHASLGQEEDSKVYDENEWIPIAPQRVVEIDADKPPVQSKKASPRVLNLNEPHQRNTFFPIEEKQSVSGAQIQPFQQYLRETTNVSYQKTAAPQRAKAPHLAQQHPYKFERIPINGQPVKDEPPQFTFQTTQPQFAQVQFYQPQEYHTIPEEYLNPQFPQPQSPNNYQTINLQNVEIPAPHSLRPNSSVNVQFPEKKTRPQAIPQFNSPFGSQKGEDKENVQLLYVPLESLTSKAPHRLHAYQQAPVPEIQQPFDPYKLNADALGTKQQQIQNIQSDFVKQAADAHKLQLQLQQQPYALPIVDFATEKPAGPTTTIPSTTKKPSSKKRKAHQPPLAVYMGGAEDADVTDVLTLLKDAKTIDVQDAITPSSPKIFVGPSNLNAPTGYAKFDLPYLSSIDSNRVERKVEQLPFFVAPLSYKTPPGYSKIPLPSPHVGSVVVSNKEKLTEKDAAPSMAQGHLQNLPEAYQLQPLYESRQPDYSVRPVLSSTTPRYSKPIPDQHVINQFEIDEINAFLPQQYQKEEITSTQRLPVTYNFEQFRRPTVSHIRFGTAIPPAQTQYTEDQYIDELLNQQQQQPKETTYQRPQQYDQYLHQKVTPQFARPQQYSEEAEEPETRYVEQHQTRTRPESNRGRPAVQPSSSSEEYKEQEYVRTRPESNRGRPAVQPSSSSEEYKEQEVVRTRPESNRGRPVVQPGSSSEEYKEQEIVRTRPESNRGRPAVHQSTSSEEYIEQEIVKTTRAPAKVRTNLRPQQSYEGTRTTTHLRSRPPLTTTPQPDQYLKETIIEQKPKSRPSSVQIDEERYQFVPVRSSTLRPQTPSAYSVHVQPSTDSRVRFQYEDEEEKQPIRPVIYKYKQSSDEETHQNQQEAFKFSTPRTQIYTTPQSSRINENVKINQGNFVTGPQSVYQEEYVSPHVKTQNANVENYNLDVQPQPQQPQFIQQQHTDEHQLPNLINNLEVQSVRQLLHPGLIPTSPKTSNHYQHILSSTAVPVVHEEIITTTQAPTSNYPSTHLPVVESTTKKTIPRGRQRGSRYPSTTESSINSSTRKPITRGRRPLPTRTRHQDEDVTSSPGDYTVRTTESTKKPVTIRSRFRTRGRPTSAETTDRNDKLVYTTANDANPSTTIRVLDSVTPRLNDQYLVQNYRPSTYSHKPATEPVVIHQINQLPIKNLEEENAETTSSKFANQVLTRPRVVISTTQAPQVVSSTSRRYETEGKENASEEEFYGFFREPNFKKTETEAPVTSRPVYSSTYISSTPRYLKEDDIDVIQQQRQRSNENHQSNVNFVGEIRPKYQTTERPYQQVSYTPVTDSGTRNRVRIPSRRITTTESSNIEEGAKTTRGRTRGKVHFRVPSKPKTHNQSGEDEDVEGGNYPPNFRAFQSSTERSRFKITVDPQDDQDTYSSIYLPTYVNKEVGNKDGNYVVENYQNANVIPEHEKIVATEIPLSSPGATDAPFALPSIANTELISEKTKNNDAENFEEYIEEILGERDIVSEFEGDQRENEKITTVAPETTTHKRRKGVWKLVRRPVDDFAVAESQNPTGGQINLIASEEVKEKNESVKHQDTSEETSTEPVIQDTTILSDVDVNEVKSTTTESASFFDSIYTMFGISNEEEKKLAENSTLNTEASVDIDNDITTTLESEKVKIEEATTSIPKIEEQESHEFTTPLTSMTYITPMSLETWNKGIVKTSTSTEISHETEICYKGKCIKSKDIKVPMT